MSQHLVTDVTGTGRKSSLKMNFTQMHSPTEVLCCSRSVNHITILGWNPEITTSRNAQVTAPYTLKNMLFSAAHHSHFPNICNIHAGMSAT
jgi:hypothetical protein